MCCQFLSKKKKKKKKISKNKYSPKNKGVV